MKGPGSIRVFLLIICLYGLLGANVSAQTSFSMGEDLFMQNRPQEALVHLEAVVAQDPAHVQAFLYLGISYLQLGRINDAISTYTAILPRGGSETARIAFNLGNAHFMNGSHDLALEAYTRTLQADPAYSAAYLNRGNTLVRTGDLNGALRDYEAYLRLEPNSPKRPEVMQLMAFIREEAVLAEERRAMAEEIARIAEQERLIAEETARAEAELARQRAEEAAQAEAERRRLLLLEVTQSLQSAAEDSQGLSAGFEDVQIYDGEFELE
ncbi:MAG: tetratricopeptide repeat protein [Treponema sp.]|nr:tetratricopeptide repeat protein [Treponema sp.]